ncbi:DUF2459 domain-containing protein [uncultured Hymenobacter sp.]|uniref:DUF2459 domain-containing protein n=1 Tax=uncultured Hymenobacter sp. TaxID=170016 RepID=UPI0035C9A63F
MKLLRKTVKIVGYTLGGILAVLLIYAAAAYGLALIPVAAEPVPPGGERVVVYLFTPNDVHTDLVLPVRTSQKDWSQEIKYSHTTSRDSAGYDYLAFGWGDKGFFYIPGWGDLTVPIALRAAFHLGTTAMHTTYHTEAELMPGPSCVRLELTPAQYKRLVTYVRGSFRPDAASRVQYLPGHTYAGHDAFYEGQWAYSFWHTCNTWTNNGLKAAGQRAVLWTPLAGGLFAPYKAK